MPLEWKNTPHTLTETSTICNIYMQNHTQMLTDKYTYKPYRKKKNMEQFKIVHFWRNRCFLAKQISPPECQGFMGCCQGLAMGFLVFRIVAAQVKQAQSYSGQLLVSLDLNVTQIKIIICWKLKTLSWFTHPVSHCSYFFFTHTAVSNTRVQNISSM